MTTSPRVINGGTLRESAMARLFRRLSDYNSILLLVDAAMLPYETGERKREHRVSGLLQSAGLADRANAALADMRLTGAHFDGK